MRLVFLLLLFACFEENSGQPITTMAPSLSIVDEFDLKHRNTLSVPALASALVGMIIFLGLAMKWMEKNYLFLRQYI